MQATCASIMKDTYKYDNVPTFNTKLRTELQRILQEWSLKEPQDVWQRLP